MNRDPWACDGSTRGILSRREQSYVLSMIDRDGIRLRWETLGCKLDEREQRLFAANEVQAAGHGALVVVSEITGLARSTINRGEDDLDEGPLPEGRVRRKGGGPKPLSERDPTLVPDLQRHAEPATMGDPVRPLKWVSKSPAKLAEALKEDGHEVSPNTVAKLLEEKLEYSRQFNRKTHEGASHPDRNAQFEYINRRVKALQRRGQPVISVDTKKKELVGNFRNGGCEWRPAGDPLEVRVHDFQDPERGKAIPYGVYDLTNNEAWVSVGVDHDTAAFAVQTIQRWWRKMGRKRFPDARELLVTADGGGSNSARCKLWKIALQEFADETGLKVHVCHFPPGTSKWNKIEHRLFCHITRNWRGQPLDELEIIVQLIGRTTTREGLKVKAALDRRNYPKGVKVAHDDFAAIQLQPAKFHGDWNYTIAPRS